MLRNTSSLLFKWLLGLLLFIPFSLHAQELSHVPGAILVKPTPGSSIEELKLKVNALASHHVEISSVCTQPFPIWLIQSNAAIQNEYLLLEKVRLIESVEVAQFDFILNERLIPNDPHFPSQWHFINIGNNGGTPDADLDAEEAWDITTGGLTSADGDTIVVCMIDEGLDVSHPDLVTNLWYNHSEIPDNNIDDDGNGYVDDYKGWNINTMDDNLENSPNAGWHGTPVAGVIGAKGNNGIGVSGINWNVKIMTVIRGNTMGQTLAAYAYPYIARKKYNESNGAQGAFVVATNSSWGIDFGQPEEAALWCSFYDSLGMVGILNSAATANGNYNIDQVGDLPTACSSDFLIAVTNIDFNNQKHPNAAYGLNTIDLAAYGTDIWSVKKNNSYGSFTGTSAASPAVAGAIALLYAAPCPDISWYAKSNPASTAQLIKNYLLESSTAISGLNNITVSGGCLNLKSAIDMVMENCAFADCFVPEVINAPVTSENSAVVSWLTAPNASSTKLRYRKLGTIPWTIIYNADNPAYIPNLEVCATYEFQLNSVCGSLESGYSMSATFKTKGCCVPPADINIIDVSGNAVDLNWPISTGVNSYNIRYRAIGALNWIEWNSFSNLLHLSDLMDCTSYEIQIQANCNNGTTTSYSPSFIFQTSSCDNCLEYNYCPVSFNSTAITWLSYIQLNDLENSSAFGTGGYTDFTGVNSATLYTGLNYDLTIETSYDFLQIPMYFFAWMDLNQNGFFEAEELLLNSQIPLHSCTASIHISIDATSGTCRLRILASEFPIDACGQSNFQGEAEDYCVTILENTTCIPPQNINWTVDDNQLTVSWLSGLISETFEVRYREKANNDWQVFTTTLHHHSIENLESCTDYEFQVRAECNGEHSLYTPLQPFRTTGCAPCLDLDYCMPLPGITNFEWIAGFKLGSINQVSGGDGYLNFANSTTTELIRSNNYTFEFTAGFSGEPYEEHYAIWIDFNQDGTFDDQTEKVFQTAQPTMDEVITGSCNIPSSALEGATRMRVSMQYYLPAESACNNGVYFGEVEDYCVTIRGNLSQPCSTPFEVYTTAVSDTSAFIEWEGNPDLAAYQFRYRLPGQNWTVFTSQNNYQYLGMLTPCAEYEYQVRHICENGISSYSDLVHFTTNCFTTTVKNPISELQAFAFPNPFTDRLHIRLPALESGFVDVRIYNSTGKEVAYFSSVQVQAGSLILNLSNLPSGLYILKTKDGILLKVMRM